MEKLKKGFYTAMGTPLDKDGNVVAESLAKGLECSSEDEEWLLSFIKVIETSLSEPEPLEYICSYYLAEGGWYY